MRRFLHLSRLRWRRRLRSLGALILLAGLAYSAWSWLPVPVATVPLVHVIDGDSLSIRQGEARVTIRLTGIDAVEYRQSCIGKDQQNWPCGREARSALEKIAGRGPLHCELGARDRHGRTLAMCRTRPDPDGVDLGAEMVRQGWAVATGDAYMIEEVEAQARRRGIWQGPFVRPAEWRTEKQRTTGVLANPGL